MPANLLVLVLVLVSSIPFISKVNAEGECDHCPTMIKVPIDNRALESASAEHKEELQAIKVGHFYISRDEITRTQYKACILAKVCEVADWTTGGELAHMPAVRITRDEAQVYVDWLSSETGKDYQIISAAEWTYVALYHDPSWWKEAVASGEVNCSDCDFIIERTTYFPGMHKTVYGEKGVAYPVEQLYEGPVGVRGLLGNVSEFTRDCLKVEGEQCTRVLVKGSDYGSLARLIDPAKKYQLAASGQESELLPGFKLKARNSHTGFRVTYQ